MSIISAWVTTDSYALALTSYYFRGCKLLLLIKYSALLFHVMITSVLTSLPISSSPSVLPPSEIARNGSSVSSTYSISITT